MSNIALLLVDDEQMILESLRIELETALRDDYRIEMAQDSEEALEVFSELLNDNYDIPLVIADYIMPGLRGDELLQRIHFLSPKTFKIMLTGQADISGITNAINGANLYRYIAKPWQAEDLKLTVQEAIDSYFQKQALQERTAQLAAVNQELTQTKVKLENYSHTLEQSEEKFRQLAENIHQVFWISTPNTSQILYASPVYEQIWGRSLEELYADSMSWVQAIHPDDRSILEQALKRQTQTGEGYDIEYRIIRPDGESRWIRDRSFPIQDESGMIYRMAGIADDITERKQAEAALEDNEKRLRLALMAANQGLYDLDLTTEKVIVSDEYVTMLGYDSEGFPETQTKWFEQIHPDDQARVIRAYQAYVVGDIPEFKIEFRRKMKNGDWKWILSLGKIVAWDENNKPLRMLGTHTDISDRKYFETERENLLLEMARLNWELEQANKQLADYSHTLEQKVEERTTELKTAQQRILAQEKLASLGTLTAGVAHELRNPLNFVKNYAEGSIEISQDLSETLKPVVYPLASNISGLVQELITDLQENSTSIQYHSQRIEQIIKSMMQHTHGGYEQAMPELTNLHELLDQAVKLAYHVKRSQDNDFNLDLRTDYQGNLKPISAVPGNLIRAFINLIDNACDAMRSKQRQLEKIVSSIPYTPTLSIVSNLLEDQVEIRIRDNGCGIAPENKSKILDPFFTTKPPGEGSGLGLSLTHDIIMKQHQGTLTIESKLGEFTEIILTLPSQS